MTQHDVLTSYSVEEIEAMIASGTYEEGEVQDVIIPVSELAAIGVSIDEIMR